MCYCGRWGCGKDIGADVFLLAFSLISKASYENISKKGEELKKLIGAVIYIECSSKTQQ
ncbi:hypothetical protein G4B88_009830, partial [Cannabis sativa]